MYAVAIPDWRVSLQDHHEGYISWEEFLHNQERLEKNRTNGEETVLAGRRAKAWRCSRGCCCVDTVAAG